MTALLGATAQARESLTSAPSAQLVADFFDDLIKIIFLNPEPDASHSVTSHSDTSRSTGQVTTAAPVTASAAGPSATGPANDRAAAIRVILARSIDAAGISHFILGRYARETLPTNSAPVSPAGSSPTAARTSAEAGFLDFAAASVMRLTPHRPVTPTSGPSFPALSVFAMTMRPDQTRLVQTELVLADGRRLPLTWEVAAKPAGLRIEDVTCLGISIRLMLRSAVAEAAAEHPADVHDLAALLQVDRAFASFPADAVNPQP